MPASRSWGYVLIDAGLIAVVGVLVLIPESRYWLPERVSGHQADIYTAEAAILATLLGFMVAALAIMLTIGGRRLTRTYVSSPLYGKTLTLFHATAVWLALATLVAFVGLFLDPSPAARAPRETQNLWVWAAVAGAGVAAWRFFFSLSVLKQVTDLVVADFSKDRPSISERPPDSELTAEV